MYTSFIISILFLSHILGDFYFQNGNMAFEKKFNKKILFKHSFYHFLISSVLTSIFFGLKIIKVNIIIFLSHYLIDRIKIYIEKRVDENSLCLFFLDQFLHILVIFSLYPITKKFNYSQTFISFSDFLCKNYTILKNINSSLSTIFIFLISFLLFLINGGTVLTKLFISQFQPPKMNTCFSREAITSEEGTIDNLIKYNGGELIGILERILIFILVILNKFTAVSFVITTKSIARFEKIQEDKSFSDMFLIGTLASFSIAIFSGIIFNIIIYSHSPNLYEFLYKYK